MKVTVLSGGLSVERDAALCSSAYAVDALRGLGHEVAFLDMYMGIEDYGSPPIDDLFRLPVPQKWRAVAPAIPTIEQIVAGRKDKSPSKLGPGVLETLMESDAVFLDSGGDYGEDGRIQGMLDILGIPYTGSRHTGTAIAIDKALTKRLVRACGIATPDWISFRGNAPDPGRLAGIGFPCVVKNPTGGSSIGTYVVASPQQLGDALQKCLELNPVAMVEKFVAGREFSCGILAGKPLPPIEIVSDGYDYRNKYLAETLEICPAGIPESLDRRIRAVALAVHETLGLRNYSRSDFILSPSGELFFLECNVLPGLSPKSLFPKEAAAAGISYPRLCETMLLSAFE
ncbi:MAG: D-alanine--D-alanine ligase [Kiritimatiellae bacterium]|nr:D-alanine--D-alanine ligase [Kiritimatiellia bacterium]